LVVCLHSFERRHNSITPEELKEMLKTVNFSSLDALVEATVPANIRRKVCGVPKDSSGARTPRRPPSY
jgi:glycine cleavage system pyridoxal-binding protein P